MILQKVIELGRRYRTSTTQTCGSNILDNWGRWPVIVTVVGRSTGIVGEIGDVGSGRWALGAAH